jgi:hypothetical protein
MKETMLEHYTSLAQHHREKLSFLAGVYLTLGQLLVFSPNATLSALRENLLGQHQSVPDIILLGGSLCSLFSLLTVGVLHHLCNVIIYATLRLHYERKCLIKDHCNIKTEWERRLETHLRTSFSLSRISALIASLLAGVMWMLIVCRIAYIIKYLFGDTSQVNMFVGGFVLLQFALVIGYASLVITRGRRFYIARSFLKCVERSQGAKELQTALAQAGIELSVDAAKEYHSRYEP